MPEFLFAPTPHQEAIDFLKSKPVVSRATFNQLLPELKGRAFTITGIEDLSVLQAIRDRVADLPAGVPWDEAKKDLVEKLHPFLDHADEENPDAPAPGIRASEARAELLLRTHGFQAYQAAAYEVMERQTDVMPYWQYHTMEDDRVRPTHAALDGVILPANHEFWKTHFPPWDWGCRCQAIPLSEDDYKDAKAADKAKPKDQRDVLPQGEQDELTSTRRLVRNGRVTDVSSPAERGRPGAFEWHPGSLRIPLDELRQRYVSDPNGGGETWAKFESFARRQSIEHQGNHVSVWDWLNGTPADEKPHAVFAQSLPAAPVPARSRPTGPRVSAAVAQVETLKRQRPVVTGVLDTIDAVHGDGALRAIPFNNRISRGSGGTYWSTPDRAGSIGVARASAGGEAKINLAHEIGHWLDHIGIASQTKFASEDAAGALREFADAARRSDAFAKIVARPASSYRAYLMRGREVFARAYSQFIATESGDSEMLARVAEITKRPSALWPEQHWTEADFAPLHSAMKKTFQKLGWMQ